MFLFQVLSSQLVYRATLLTLTTIVVLTLATQFGKYLYLELTTHFRLQYVIAAVICSVSLIAFQSWKFVPIAILCALMNAVGLWPYYRSNPERKTDSSGTHLRFLQANVLKNNTNYKVVLDLVNEINADIVVLQEITDAWPTQTTALEVSYPYFEMVPLPEGAGMGLFSRFPLEDLQILHLDSSAHFAIVARVNLGQKSLTVLALHPPAPIVPTKFKNRNRQFLEAALLLNTRGGPKILIGDLNTTMWSPYFTWLARNSGLRDARMGFGLQTSWPMPLPSFLRLAIDHCLVSTDVYVDSLRIGARIDSDHRPVIVDVTI
jgi:endonuclease/exonuclease/phosphatase (EEP) superfamily protein YafD